MSVQFSTKKSIRLQQVVTRADLHQFIRVPWSIYRDDPNWVPPLLLERKEHLSPKNPFFEHAIWRAWIAWQDDRPVGRISAQIDTLHQQQQGTDHGTFGMLEAEDNPELFASLLGQAEEWLRSKGIKTISGPFNLSVNEECGLLTEGFETPPFIMMGHARPYYGSCVEQQGYVPAQGLLAYYMDPGFEAPPVMRALIKNAGANITVRPLRRKQLKQELTILRDIFNDAWSKNWGFVPFTEAEFQNLGKTLTMLVDDDFIQIAELNGEPVAMIAGLPNINEIIRDLNGRLFPTGWIKLLWRLKVQFPKTARVPLMGVRKQYQHTRLGPALAFLVVDELRQALVRRGVEHVEMSWVLENNQGMRNIIETVGGKPYKRYQLYTKTLAD